MFGQGKHIKRDLLIVCNSTAFTLPKPFLPLGLSLERAGRRSCRDPALARLIRAEKNWQAVWSRSRGWMAGMSRASAKGPTTETERKRFQRETRHTLGKWYNNLDGVRPVSFSTSTHVLLGWLDRQGIQTSPGHATAELDGGELVCSDKRPPK